MTSTTTSIYSTFIDHNESIIIGRAKAARAAGDGMAWGEEGSGLEEAAAEMGATVVGSTYDGLVCELSDRLYMLSDIGGAYAVEVATQEDDLSA